MPGNANQYEGGANAGDALGEDEAEAQLLAINLDSQIVQNELKEEPKLGIIVDDQDKLEGENKPDLEEKHGDQEKLDDIEKLGENVQPVERDNRGEDINPVEEDKHDDGDQEQQAFNG